MCALLCAASWRPGPQAVGHALDYQVALSIDICNSQPPCYWLAADRLKCLTLMRWFVSHVLCP
jgi:hypothetical protein